MFNHILLCTHGTPGAQRAERWVFEEWLNGGPPPKVTVLTVLNEDWKWMVGDDWLNTSRTRRQFMQHVVDQVSEEIREDWQRIQDSFPQASRAAFVQVVGSVEETIARTAKQSGCDLIVMGPYQKKQGKGFKDRIRAKTFHPLLPCPVLVAP